MKLDALEKIQERLQDTTSAAGAAFSTLTSSITAGVDAAIMGSESIGKAVLKAAAASLKGIAIESAARAAFNTAMGFASAANPFTAGAAPGYFAAAKSFAVAAALAGAGAAGLYAAGGSGGGSGGGGGGGGGPGSTPGGGYAPYRSSGGGEGPVNITMHVNAMGVTDRKQAAVALAEATEEAFAARRTRSTSRTRVTRYDEDI
jgi:hypothetical protein